MHVSCAGLTSVPSGDWLCDCCLEIMEARRKKLLGPAHLPSRSLEAKLPTPTPLNADTLALAAHAEQRFFSDITARKERAIEQLEENQRILAIESQKRIENLKRDIIQAKVDENVKMGSYYSAARAIRHRLKLVDWKINDLENQ